MSTGYLAVRGGLFLKQRLEAAARRHDDLWMTRALTETSEFGQAVAIAIVAAVLGREPFEEEVQNFLRETTDDESFMPRMYRLMAELVKSPSARKRKRLAAVLVGGPALSKTPDERDRLDILIEWLLDEDIDALKAVHVLRNIADRRADRDSDYTVCLARHRDGFRIVRGDLLPSVGAAQAHVETDRLQIANYPVVGGIVVDNLQAAGCIRVSGGTTVTVNGIDVNRFTAPVGEPSYEVTLQGIELTALGQWLVEKLVNTPLGPVLGEGSSPRSTGVSSTT